MRNRKSLFGAAFSAGLGAAIVTALVACSSPTGPDVRSSDTDTAPQGQMVAQGSMVKAYLTAEELAADSTLLVLGDVVEAGPATISRAEVTRYVLRVERVIGGTAADEIAVYQFGQPGMQLSVEGPQYLEQGERYVLFVRPTDLPAGQPANDGYYIVGPGAWAESGDSRFDIWVDATRSFELGSIPTSFALTDVAIALSADRVGAAH